ncbi:FAD-dependent oxidoreductase [Aurantibacter crassamenti]|uniref:FAD-dependent oxidoreductase n=1 Tax=Aurantibacter crassamenti TaxID=1837375 RepID=UPI0019392962|nr:FAD-dependent oxidoreductase [Aurantibacter crassamenti]MBM1107037.1 FAD-dependent oxidoreductase [Aurantibacter crassamenti]
MKRRLMLKSMGAVSLGMVTPALAKGESLVAPYTVKEERITTDILVVGGGSAGSIAAIQAGRAGAATILIESGSQLGGTTTTGGVSFPGIFHAWGKQIIGGIGWELVMDCVELNGDKLPNFSKIPDSHWKHQVTINASLYTLLAEEKCREAGVDIRYYESPTRIEFNDGKWIVESVGKGTKTTIICNQIIDCTGNALIASMAGYDVLREDDTQPGSLIFRLGGYDYNSLDMTKIPKKYHRVLRQNMLENSKRTSSEHTYVPYSYVYVPGADSTTSATHTIANNEGRNTLLKLVRELKVLPGCENLTLVDLKTETAVRETYRIDGLYKMNKDDYTSGKVFEDAISHSFYPIDLHRNGKSIYQEFLKPDVVASIPLRALIPKKSQNFLVAGRCVSSDRLANSALRVQASCMGMGQAAAVAAVLANKKGISPADLDYNEVKDVLKKHGAIIPTHA